MSIERGYSEGPFGQVHWRKCTPAQTSAPDLYCLHPAPYSGLAFENLMPLMSTQRRVIALDYPGYGGSDPMPNAPTIPDYAMTVAHIADALSGNVEIDLLGFHTGCLVAAELALQYPRRIRKACLIDCPTFPPDQAEILGKKNGAPFEVTPDITCLEGIWSMSLAKRLECQPPNQAMAMLSEHLRSGHRMNEAFHAAFAYPWTSRFVEVSTQILVLASQSPLLNSSKAAARALQNAKLLERLDITRSVLDEAADKIAPDILSFLNDKSDL